ncbi:G-type lectin S-receptor-like serine/threonine-protein kinase At4g03230 isoform X2 [Eucalyptus grandis]|uniref:G-type lectin S-receptor-like serine/threonine-protein kinase At4g03230 isoform X2 n=1 Tax=Eucalyptus grandis TaxID=71139 RepID=UPI00192F0012|nr:G-type lectin S-receptor-like serine/threonine-protein kinase At4g03230 isoform X2 [Eucalyptus grandis]
MDGDLQLRHKGPAIRLINVRGSSSSTLVVKLLDTGNLVLLEDDRSETVLWQSFNHPTDTFLPGMLMINGFNLTSWASQEDPKQGMFTFQRDQESGSNEYKVVQDLSPYWRSGVHGDFIQADENLYAIILLPNDSLGLASGRLVMNHTGQIQYFSLKNGTEPVWSKPKDKCSVLNACGKFGSCNIMNGNETMCRCLPGFKPAQLDNRTPVYSSGCLRKSSKCCGKNSNGADHFLSLKMMKVRKSDMQIRTENEEKCRQKCLHDFRCQAYSFMEDQSRAADTCYTWSDYLDNIQEFARDGHDLYVRVPLSDIESTNGSCGTCGTNLVPYPLSTGQSCGDPLYSAFSCDSMTAQLYFELPMDRYRITSVNPETRIFTIQVNERFKCMSEDLKKISQRLGQSGPFAVSGGCIGGQTDFSADASLGSVRSSEVKIVWRDPKEPLCNSSKDCDWPNATCKSASDGITKCLCDSGFSWNSSNVSCSPAGVGNNVEGGGSSQKRQKVKPVYIVAPAVAAIFILVFGGLFYMRRQHGSRESTLEILDFRLYESEKRIKMWMDSCQFEEEDKKGIEVPFFDLEIILQATNHFSDENKLGRGGFGPVYKATFPRGQEIAVKRLLSGSGQGLEEFKNEVVLIAKLQHRNLVKLVGYCVEGDEKMLLYEYMPNKSLDSFIFDRTRCSLLTWEIRFEIILGIARGMLYLHQDSRLRIIHRDLKTSNVLLDEEMTPKISDFGLARIFEAKQTEACTKRVIGTYETSSIPTVA